MSNVCWCRFCQLFSQYCLFHPFSSIYPLIDANVMLYIASSFSPFRLKKKAYRLGDSLEALLLIGSGHSWHIIDVDISYRHSNQQAWSLNVVQPHWKFKCSFRSIICYYDRWSRWLNHKSSPFHLLLFQFSFFFLYEHFSFRYKISFLIVAKL